MGVNGPGTDNKTLGIERTYLRLAVLGTLIVACFVALFSRLWFLQVLAADDYRRAAKQNRVRRVYSEPTRGRILDRNGVVLVTSRESLAVTVDRQVVSGPHRERRVLRRLASVLEVKRRVLRERLNDGTVSPYKPVAVANDVPERKAIWIVEHQERFPGVDVEALPVRSFPEGNTAAHILGYVGEISRDQLRSTHFKGARPRYQPGDIVGKPGLEWYYDRLIRGRPEVRTVVVNSTGEVVASRTRREERPGNDLVLGLDVKVQRLVERALADGIAVARQRYLAPAGGVVVMDPNNGQVLGMASFPSFDPAILADGITTKEFDALGQATPDDPDDDALLNRTIQASTQPGSTFKVVTAGAAMATGTATPYSVLNCPGAVVYPPEGGPGSVVFPNWTSVDFGYIGFPESLEISCDTFYYELGWRMEERWGAANGDGSERFQRYMRQAGFGRETGIDLANEHDGLVPDQRWCKEVCAYDEWLPGYTVNMAIGQGDLQVNPLQMAVTYAAIANGGKVLEPRLGMGIARTSNGEQEILREFNPKVVRRLPLDATELAVIEQGLVDVISGDQGTATTAFAGFPTDLHPIAGKTGTAQIGESEDLNRAWFVSYAPVDDPRYVIAVYLEKAGHGGESAAPIARQIYEGLFGIDKNTNEVYLGEDPSR
jgi:penicillin-binding protein 2